MTKFVRKPLSIACVLLCFLPELSSQGSLTVENYHLVDADRYYTWTPIVQYQSKKKFYSELRYNYEGLHTVSLFAGRLFEFGNKIETSIKPIAGFSVGDFNGFSLGFNADLEYGRFYLSSQTQISIGTRKDLSDFFYTWSELGYYIVKDKFYAGYIIQHLRQKPGNETDQGILAALEFNDAWIFETLSVPMYVFRPFSRNSSYMLGITMEFDFGKRKNKNPAK